MRATAACTSTQSSSGKGVGVKHMHELLN
jgi:hypothetical protein